MITIDNKEYDETKLSEKARIAIAQLQLVAKNKYELTWSLQNQEVLQAHYSKVIQEELPKEKESKLKS
jgi:hypothetical protein|tara:strand:+ start:244 stop:447 length:204 start_codon:yes stop_codon:yes gene_type:complete